jgi:hypothetical protein
VATRSSPGQKAKRTGRPRIFPTSQLFHLRLPAELHAAIERYARQQGRSVNLVLLEAVEDWWRTLQEGRDYKPVRPRPGTGS